MTVLSVGSADAPPIRPASSRRRRINILGVGIDPVDMNQAVATIERWKSAGIRDYVCCVCVHGTVEAQHDPSVRRALNQAGLATGDGMPLVWWCRLAGRGPAKRVCGSDLLDALCRDGIARGYRHYFYGATPDVLEQLSGRLRRRYPGINIAGCRAPPFRTLTEEEDEAEVKAINEAAPDLVWVGLGMPKQERWMHAHLGRVNATALIGIGAAFDFHAGAKPRAPRLMQQAGLEWLFRLGCEPRRLFRRYMVYNAVFVLRAIEQALGLRTYGDPDTPSAAGKAG